MTRTARNVWGYHIGFERPSQFREDTLCTSQLFFRAPSLLLLIDGFERARL